MTQTPKDASEAPRERPWQIMLAGPSLGAPEPPLKSSAIKWQGPPLQRRIGLRRTAPGNALRDTASEVSKAAQGLLNRQ